MDMGIFKNKYKSYFSNKSFLISTLLAVVLLIISLVVNFYAALYATERASNSVTDLILSNIPVFDADGIFVYGAELFFIFIFFLCVLELKIIPFTLKSIALFVIVRSIFVSLTHIGPFPDHTMINSNFIGKFTFGADLFFSGHTGLPFLMALVFWDSKFLRYLFIASSVLFGIVVLMTHLHYSIDVLGAYFITFSIFRLAELFFKKDLILFKNGLKN